MNAEVLGYAAITLLLGACATLVPALRRNHSAKRHCPGPRKSLLTRLHPATWFWRIACWYDLTGLPTRDNGGVRCPECGTVSLPRSLLRDGRRWRPWSVAGAMFAAAAACIAIPWLDSGKWTSCVPDLALVGVEHLPRRYQPREMRRELALRVDAGSLDSLSQFLLARKLVGDLRDDDIRGNAERADEMLRALWPWAEAPLIAVLRSDDRQQRLIARTILRDRAGPECSDALLAAMFEDLRDDAGLDMSLYTCWNAGSATEFLAQFPRRIGGMLDAALGSDDAQQRFLAAVLAARTGHDELLERFAPILVENLRDDEVAGNAWMALAALQYAKTRAIPYLRPFVDSNDAQLRGIALALIERLEHPERRRDQLVHRLPHITEITNDPLADDVDPLGLKLYGWGR